MIGISRWARESFRGDAIHHHHYSKNFISLIPGVGLTKPVSGRKMSVIVIALARNKGDTLVPIVDKRRSET